MLARGSDALGFEEKTQSAYVQSGIFWTVVIGYECAEQGRHVVARTIKLNQSGIATLGRWLRRDGPEHEPFERAAQEPRPITAADDWGASLDRPSIPLEWVGAGSAALGLAGAAENATVARVLQHGTGPHGETLRTGVKADDDQNRVLAYAVVWSAPKTVSLLLASEDAAVREAAAQATRLAADGFLSTLEQYLTVRRGAGGKRSEAIRGLVGVRALHRTSSAGDPHLHVHWMIAASAASAVDGAYRALDGRVVFEAQKWASAAANVAMQRELQRSLGITDWQYQEAGSVPVPEIAALNAGIDAVSQARHHLQAIAGRLGIPFALRSRRMDASLWRRHRETKAEIAERLEHEMDEALHASGDAARFIRAHWRSVLAEAGVSLEGIRAVRTPELDARANPDYGLLRETPLPISPEAVQRAQSCVDRHPGGMEALEAAREELTLPDNPLLQESPGYTPPEEVEQARACITSHPGGITDLQKALDGLRIPLRMRTLAALGLPGAKAQVAEREQQRQHIEAEIVEFRRATETLEQAEHQRQVREAQEQAAEIERQRNTLTCEIVELRQALATLEQAEQERRVREAQTAARRLLSDLTQTLATFAPSDVVARLVALEGVSVAQAQQAAAQLLRYWVAEESIHPGGGIDLELACRLLECGGRSDRTADLTHLGRKGSLVPDRLVQLEAELSAKARQLSGIQRGRFVVPIPDDFSPEQQRAAVTVAQGRALTVTIGVAGAGKTHLARPIVAAAKGQGMAVRVLSRNRALAEALGRDLDCPAEVFATFDGERGQNQPTLLIVDEAGLADRDDLVRILDAVQSHPAWRAWLIGDRAQAQPIDRLASFAVVEQAVEGVALSQLMTSYRCAAWEEEHAALRSLKTDDDEGAQLLVSRVRTDGRLVAVSEASPEARYQTLAEIGERYRQSGEDALILTRDNASAGAVSSYVQALRGIEVAVHTSLRHEQHAGVGDHIRVRRNDRRLGVINGEVYTVRAIGADGALTVQSRDRRRLLRLPKAYTEEAAELAYAVTADSAQGVTVDRAIVAADGVGRSLLYSAATRGRQAPVYVVTASDADGALLGALGYNDVAQTMREIQQEHRRLRLQEARAALRAGTERLRHLSVPEWPAVLQEIREQAGWQRKGWSWEHPLERELPKEVGEFRAAWDAYEQARERRKREYRRECAQRDMREGVRRLAEERGNKAPDDLEEIWEQAGWQRNAAGAWEHSQARELPEEIKAFRQAWEGYLARYAEYQRQERLRPVREALQRATAKLQQLPKDVDPEGLDLLCRKAGWQSTGKGTWVHPYAAELPEEIEAFEQAWEEASERYEEYLQEREWRLGEARERLQKATAAIESMPAEAMGDDYRKSHLWLEAGWRRNGVGEWEHPLARELPEEVESFRRAWETRWAQQQKIVASVGLLDALGTDIRRTRGWQAQRDGPRLRAAGFDVDAEGQLVSLDPAVTQHPKVQAAAKQMLEALAHAQRALAKLQAEINKPKEAPKPTPPVPPVYRPRGPGR